MLRLRLLAAAAALVGLAAFAAPKYTIDFPQGWSEPKPDGDAVEVQAPAELGKAWCRAGNAEMPTITASQEDLNTAFADPWTVEIWAEALNAPADKLKLTDASAEVVDGHIVQRGTITFAADAFGAETTARLDTHVMTGRMVNAACFAEAAKFEGLKDLFDRTVRSLKPI